MSKKIAIIDYEMSNLFSVQNACLFIGLDAVITKDIDEILASDAAILPGVGAFGEAMNNLKKLDLINPIKDFAASGKPFMGICLGLQLLFNESEEFGNHKGLELIPGKVKKFPSFNDLGKKIRVPQIGWNQILNPGHFNWSDTPLKSLNDNEFMYFVHSFYVKPDHNEDILTLTHYEGINYCSGILKSNIIAFQFHPEKSSQKGISIYRNWALKYNLIDK